MFDILFNYLQLGFILGLIFVVTVHPKWVSEIQNRTRFRVRFWISIAVIAVVKLALMALPLTPFILRASDFFVAFFAGLIDIQTRNALLHSPEGYKLIFFAILLFLMAIFIAVFQIFSGIYLFSNRKKIQRYIQFFFMRAKRLF